MAKELPFFKHEPSEWLEGEIQVCSDAAIVCFSNLISGYWLKLGSMSYAFALQKYCRRNAEIIEELINSGIVDREGDSIRIAFLDKQLGEFKTVSKARSKAAHERWAKKGVDANAYANALQLESTSNAIREEKRREEEIREDKSFDEFWDLYNHKIDRKKCIDKWKRLTDKNHVLAIKAIPIYLKSVKDKKYLKNPLTWLNGECWNDEMIEPIKNTDRYVEHVLKQIPL
jgi:hypothetical protein